ncbi:hypothetical protein MINT15_05850 [Saccharomonospora viridis]|uniref:Uncharacterized protein n=1 Tax=Saccharomonospora viridis TaxID=1852 RepID=A0A837DEH6_9PSEU|nr:hypothetical protein MINT15_05850 [Saccharomonospora viridis]
MRPHVACVSFAFSAAYRVRRRRARRAGLHASPRLFSTAPHRVRHSHQLLSIPGIGFRRSSSFVTAASGTAPRQAVSAAISRRRPRWNG